MLKFENEWTYGGANRKEYFLPATVAIEQIANRIILNCRSVTIIAVSILKTKCYDMNIWNVELDPKYSLPAYLTSPTLIHRFDYFWILY